jgi:alpha-tubulin suppressor-like RCC1 family protein
MVHKRVRFVRKGFLSFLGFGFRIVLLGCLLGWVLTGCSSDKGGTGNVGTTSGGGSTSGSTSGGSTSGGGTSGGTTSGGTTSGGMTSGGSTSGGRYTTTPETAILSGPSGPISSPTATFVFTSSEFGSTFECRLDEGAWTTCTSPWTYTGLSDGSHTFEVRARNPAGDLDPTPASWSFTVDTAPPDTTIQSGPSTLTTSTSPSFTFTCSESGCTFQCRLDGGSWGSCTSPKSYTGLVDGSHTFEVRGMDPAGNLDPTPASWNFTVDATPPDTTIQSGPSRLTSSTSASFTFTCTESGCTFQCRLDGGSWSSCTSPKSYTGLWDGSHTFEVRGMDPAGNLDPTPASWSFTVDATPPDTTIQSGPSSPTSSTGASFTFSCSESGCIFQCRLDGGSWSSCTSPKSYTGLVDGSHTFEVRGIDPAGNLDPTPAVWSFAVDTVPPNTTIQSGPSSPTSSTSINFAFTCSEAGCAYQCQLDSGLWEPCGSPKGYSGLSDGGHLFSVRALDQAGNLDPTPASWSFTVDTTPPDTTIQSGPSNPTSSTSVSFTFSCSESGCTFQCRLDGGGWGSCTSPRSYTGLAEGSHTFEVRGIDQAGNVDSTPAVWGFAVDTTAPETFLTGGPLPFTNVTVVDFFFTSDDPSAVFECQLNGGGFTPCGSPKQYSGLADGAYTFEVRAVDLAGNRDFTPAVSSFTVDTTPPDTTIQSGPSSPTSSTTADFTFTCSESGCTFECRLDGGVWGSCTSPRSYTGLAEGSHTFEVRGIDQAGNVDSTPASWSFTVDTPPDTTIQSGPNNPTSSTTAVFTFTCSESGCTFECRLDGGVWGSCTSPKSYTGLTDGAYTFEVRSIDTVGNIDPTPATWGFVVDTIPPTFSGLREILASSDTEVILFWEPATDDVTPQKDIVYEICQSTTAGGCVSSFTPVYTVSNQTYNYRITGLTPGVTYYFLVRARDLAGHRDGNMVEKKRERLSGVRQVSAGLYHTCAVLNDGTLRCWGNNGSGQLGNGTNTNSNLPVTVSGITNAVTVSAGGGHTCAVLNDGTLRCWGANWNGQLGNGTNTNSNLPVVVSGISNAVAVSAGWGHTCAVLNDGTLRCWGHNLYGQLGNGTNTPSNLPVTVSGISNAVAVSAGLYHTCAVLNDGTLRCWGYNGDGQLGNGTNASSNLPVTVSGISNAVAVSAGGYHTCAVLNDGTLRCWGRNWDGQLGNGTNTSSKLPVTVSGISNAVTVSAGWNHTCAVLNDSTLRCWGYNGYGQLGNGTNTSSNLPVIVSGISNAVAVSAGGFHTCAVLNDGTLRCWGRNDYGQLGDGTNTSSNLPVTVSGISNAVAVSAGGSHTCAVLNDGTLRCWGDNSSGQLGNGTNTRSNLPVIVSGISNAVAVSAGDYHTCAVLNDGTLRCWGDNSSGRLGNGTNTSSNLPVTVSGITNAVAVSAGYGHTCAVLNDGTLRCWGYNGYGQLGNGTYTNSNLPVTVSGISNAVAVSAGYLHTCAVLNDGTLRCWGWNYYGQLGDGTNTDSNLPVTVSGISNAVAVSAGGLDYGSHTCAVLNDGTLRCWGANWNGQLGNGTNTDSNLPVVVSGISNAVAVSAGGLDYGSHTCAVLNDGTLRCWGDNGVGQLGGGWFGNPPFPVPVITP